jgi:NTP pyrophosphatase (non-canonical NTP hydrolase)
MQIYKNTHEWLSAAQPEKPSFEDLKKWVIEEIEELREAIENGDRLGMYDAIADANIFLANFTYFYEMSLKQLELVANKVNESNWTKFCKTEEEAYLTVEAYINGTHPNKLGEKINCYYVKVKDNLFIVKKSSDNKILKSINFKDTCELM